MIDEWFPKGVSLTGELDRLLKEESRLPLVLLVSSVLYFFKLFHTFN